MADRKGLHVHLPADLDGRGYGEREAPVLVPVMAVGMASVPGGVSLLSKDTVVYPVGRCLAMYCPSQLSSVRVSEPLRHVRSIAALAVSPNRKYVAAAENLAEGYMPQVTLFDASTLQRLASVTGPGVTGTFTSVSFSHDGSLLLACGIAAEDSTSGPGGSSFHLWDWAASTTPQCSGALDRGEVVLRAALDPRFDTNVLVMCTRSVGLWRQSPNGAKRHPVEGVDLPPGATFVDLATLPDGRFLLATSIRDVILVDRAHAHLAFTTDRPIVCLLGLPDGVVAVGTEKGYLQLYRRAAKDDPDHFAIFSETRVPETTLSVTFDNHIRALSVDPQGDRLLCATAGGGPTYIFNLAYARTLALTPETGSDLWEALLPGTHEQGIVSAALAYKRDFLATASKDLTVRVWQTSPLRLVLTHMCHHSPLALSIDPYGRELVVAYVDGVRCYSIVEGLLVEGEELMHEFGPSVASSSLVPGMAPLGGGEAAATAAGGGGGAAGAAGGRRRGGAAAAPTRTSLDHCSLVRYSPTGALIAAAAGPAGRHVYIFSTLTKRQLAVLAGHYEAVLDLAWSDDGAYLATSGEGAVFTWAMDGFQRVQENTSKLYLNDAIACTPDFRTLVVGDTTQGLRVMETMRSVYTPPANDAHDDEDEGAHDLHGAPGTSAPATAPGSTRATAAGSVGGAAVAVVSASSGGALPTTPSASGAAPAGDQAPFRVPGRASLVPIGADTGTGPPTHRSKVQAVMRLTSTMRAPPDVTGGAATELRLRSNYQSIIQPSRGGLTIARAAAAPGLGGAYSMVLGTGVLGRVRMCPLKPRSNEDVVEYFIHAADVTQVAAHRDGRIVITADSSGCWIMHVLLPPGMAAAASAALAAAASISSPGITPGPAGALPALSIPGAVPSVGPLSPSRAGSPLRQSTMGGMQSGGGRGAAAAPAAISLATHPDRTTAAHLLLRGVLAVSQADPDGMDGSSGGAAGGQMIVSVRAVDVQLLKENVRELKDRLAKAATEAEYKMYEREQNVRRDFEGEVNRLRSEVEVLRADLAFTRATASEEASAADRLKDAMTRDFERALREQQDMFEKKLAAEISRTDAAEREMQRLRAKFGRKLWQLDEQQGTLVRDAAEKQTMLEHALETTRTDAQKAVTAAHAQTEQELRIDGELNEEELQRAAEAAQKQLEEKDEAYLKLLAKHTLQSGLNAKTSQENDRLRGEAEALRKENTRLAEQVMALTEELEAMQAAWADRDARQRNQDAEMKDMAFQMQQAQLFTSLATTRIKELNNELEPVRGARDEAMAQVAGMESVAQRQLERQAKVVSDNTVLQTRLEAAQEELQKVKGEMLEREAYFKNFTTQLFRTLQDVPHQQWPKLFGRLIDDYHKSRDKASWSRYLESDHGANAHPPRQHGSPADGRQAAAATSAEYHEKITELHAQLMHTERMLSLLTETKNKADAARRAVVSKLMSDNLMVVQELNDTKRDLKAARELAEKRAIELADLRMSVAVAGGVSPQLASQASSQLAGQASGQAFAAMQASSSGGGAQPPAAPGAAVAAPGSDGGGGGGVPQGPAGRAMARLPSRLGDPSKHAGAAAANANGSNGTAPRGSSPALSTSSSASGVGPGQGTGGFPLQYSASATIPEHALLNAGPPPPMVVTGDMPQGGWWLGECSPFELPSAIEHLTNGGGAAAASGGGAQRRYTPGHGSHATSYDGTGFGERPSTSSAVGGRRPGTSASNGQLSGRGVFISSRTAFTPPGAHSLLPPRRPETTSINLVAAAVSGAALQAYKSQQQQQQQQQQQDSQAAQSGDTGTSASASSGSHTRALSPPPKSEGPAPRALSAGPVYGGGSSSSTSGGGLTSRHSASRSPQPLPLGSSSLVGGGLPPASSSPVLPAPYLQGQVRPSTTSKVATMGAGFRSFVPTAQSSQGGGPRNSSR